MVTTAMGSLSLGIKVFGYMKNRAGFARTLATSRAHAPKKSKKKSKHLRDRSEPDTTPHHNPGPQLAQSHGVTWHFRRA
ncbi:hypothetical protein GCM10027157_18310 [Corynebacterium aquatimens]